MLKKIVFFIFIFIFQINFCFAGQGLINSYNHDLRDIQKEIDELSDYTIKYGIVKDVKYFEKLLEKYKYIARQNEIKLKAFEELIKCRENGKNCSFLGNDTQNLTLEELNILENKAEDEKHNFEKKLEDLKETVEYLQKSQKEIEKREKLEGEKSKFELKNNASVENFESESIQKKEEIKKSENLEDFKKEISKKLDNYTKSFSSEYKNKLYKAVLKRLENYKKTEKINAILEVLKEKIF